MSTPAERFASRVFFWSGLYGILALAPLYALEEHVNELNPPPMTHPENFYAFLGVALAWQLGFLLISRDPRRFRPLMLAAMAEKALPTIATVVLVTQSRAAPATLGPAALDIAMGALFAVSYVRLGREPGIATDAATAVE